MTFLDQIDITLWFDPNQIVVRRILVLTWFSYSGTLQVDTSDILLWIEEGEGKTEDWWSQWMLWKCF